MAKSPSPWSVKGVDPEAREAAKIAARRAGMTVGAWLTQIIRQSASEQLRGSRQDRQSQPYAPSEPPPPPPGYHGGQQYPPGSGTSYGPGPQHPPQPGQYPPQPPPGGSPPPAPTIQAVFESIQRLSGRIEQAEQRTTETIEPIAKKVAALSERIEQSKGGGTASTGPVERAVQRIADRLDEIEETRRPSRENDDAGDRSGGIFGFFRKD